MPSCLSALTRLQHLSLDEIEGGIDFNLLHGALPQLQQLTCLVSAVGRCELVMFLRCTTYMQNKHFLTSVQNVTPAMPQELTDGQLVPPAALATLTCLQRCYLKHRNWRTGGTGEVVALPAGPWLRSLRWLAADIATLVNSLDALQQSAALQFVCIHGTHFHEQFNWRSPAAAAFFDWLAHPLKCPSLEVVSFEERLHTSIVAHLPSILVTSRPCCCGWPAAAQACSCTAKRWNTLATHCGP